MRRLSIRKRRDGAFEVGPAGHKNKHGVTPTVVVAAANKGDALRRGRMELRARDGAGRTDGIQSAARMSFRESDGVHTRKDYNG